MDAMSCLAPPQPASFLPTAAYYADAAIARALHYSVSTPADRYSPADASPSSSSSLLPDLPCSGGWFASPALTCDSLLVASDAAPRAPSTPAAAKSRRLGLGPAAAGRAGKRRARASKRAPTTYISTDPANFRLMVQHVTGVQAEPLGADDGGPMSFDTSASAALMDCPTFGGAAYGDAVQLASGGDAAALHHRVQLQQQQQQPCYPTLDSWSVMYESGGLL